MTLVKEFFELVVYLVVRTLVALLAILPQRARVRFFSAIFRVAFAAIPRLRRTIDLNLRLAFPEASAGWRKDIAHKHARELGRLLADTIRLPSLTPEWAKQHVEIPMLERYRERLNKDRSRGILIATGHLGSFELLGHAIGLYGSPLAAVARRFSSPRFDRWWTGLRERGGNRIIDRRGAFKESVATLASGISVAILFDQNVTRNHAVFVDWFGVPAATTRSVALAALRTGAPIFVASMKYCGNDRYRVEALECDYSDISSDHNISSDQKVQRITQRLADHYCDMIRAFPEGWFWLHRRWKTRPNEGDAPVYGG